ncbi:MAG: hypothetical protein HY736_01525 [Verrucomicrobia bacterium]|nr:hypothetical protein [Verrucomicrobiota bacterium]
MKTRRCPGSGGLSAGCVSLVLVGLGLFPSWLHGQAKRTNPASKVYFADVNGDAQIDTGNAIQDLSKRSVYTAEGAIIETKKSENDRDRRKSFSTMVYSNGTGAFFDEDTRLEVKGFVQEPFLPNRVDAELEPSISNTHAFVSRGTVGLCNSKLVAGSKMNYQTPHGSVAIRGRKLVIETNRGVTKISMLEGDSTVRAGSMDMGGHMLKSGEQAIIRDGGVGQPNSIEISRIPPGEMPNLDEMVAMACMAKKTVYFEVRERTIDGTDVATTKAAAPETTAASTRSVADDAAGAGNPPVATATSGGTPSGPVTAFDGNSAPKPTSSVTVREIVPIQVVPVNLPVQFTVSPATITSSGASRPGG